MTDLKKDHTHPFNSRLEEFRNHLNLKSKKAFYQSAKIDSSQFFRVINGFQKPGFGFFEKLAIAFPDLKVSVSTVLKRYDKKNLDHLLNYINNLKYCINK